MTTKNKTITERIREYYCSSDDTDEWLVEKGKVKEGRLLKEVCETLEKLDEDNYKLSQEYNKLKYDTVLDRNEIIKPFQQEILTLKRKLDSVSSKMGSIEFKNNDILDLIKSIVKEIDKK